MIVFGLIFIYDAPKNINYVYGYRSKRSKINQESWDYAHEYFGRISFRLGIVVLILTIIAFIFLYNEDVDTIGVVGTIIMFIQLIPLFVSVFITERALKRKFGNFSKKG